MSIRSVRYASPVAEAFLASSVRTARVSSTTARTARAVSGSNSPHSISAASISNLARAASAAAATSSSRGVVRHMSNGSESVSQAQPQQWGKWLFSNLSESRFILAFVGAIVGGVWKLSTTLATKDELKHLETQLDSKIDKLDTKLDQVSSDIKDLKNVLMQNALHRENLTQRENLALKTRINGLESQK